MSSRALSSTIPRLGVTAGGCTKRVANESCLALRFHTRRYNRAARARCTISCSNHSARSRMSGGSTLPICDRAWSLPMSGGFLRWGGAVGIQNARFDLHRCAEFQEDIAAFFRRPSFEVTATALMAAARKAEMFWSVSHAIGSRLTLDGGLSWSSVTIPRARTPRHGIRA